MDIPGTLFIYTNAGISTVLSISASVVATVGFSLVINGKLEFRDIITSPIAGGVMVGCSSTYIYNPLQSLLMGSGAGISQVLFNSFEKKLGHRPLWSNGVLFLFGINGFIGGISSAVMRAINKTQNSYASSYASLPSMYVFDQSGQISATFVTLCCAVVTGLFLFILIAIFSRETNEDLYHDNAYWIIDDDGISDGRAAHASHASEPSVEVSQGGSIKGEHAYL
jgi:ammonia channel protein AmtB